MKEWDINIYRGILTGFNEAFIINEKTKNKLIEASPKNAEIIRPILRGRDIKKYEIAFANQWIIHSHNGVKSKNIPMINVIHDYPSIYDHLLNYESQLIKRLDQGDHWTNLRNCAYLDDFEKEKIVWLELTDHPNFALDTKGYYINNTIFFMTGPRLKYILAFLNSRLCEWFFDKIAATSGVGTRRWIKQYIDQICIPFPSIDTETQINSLVDKIYQSGVTNDLMKKIDSEIYQLFSLTNEEIEFVESAVL